MENSAVRKDWLRKYIRIFKIPSDWASPSFVYGSNFQRTKSAWENHVKICKECTATEQSLTPFDIISVEMWFIWTFLIEKRLIPKRFEASAQRNARAEVENEKYECERVPLDYCSLTSSLPTLCFLPCINFLLSFRKLFPFVNRVWDPFFFNLPKMIMYILVCIHFSLRWLHFFFHST